MKNERDEKVIHEGRMNNEKKEKRNREGKRRRYKEWRRKEKEERNKEKKTWVSTIIHYTTLKSTFMAPVIAKVHPSSH